MAGVMVKAVLDMPSGSRMRSPMTSPSRLPVMPSTTCPTQSMLEPYSHSSPGSKSSGVLIEAFDAVVGERAKEPLDERRRQTLASAPQVAQVAEEVLPRAHARLVRAFGVPLGLAGAASGLARCRKVCPTALSPA